MDIIGVGSIPSWVVYTAVIMIGLYIFSTWNNDFFKRRNMPYVKPLPLFGNYFSIFFNIQSTADLVNDLYKSNPGHRCVGIFEFRRPIYMIRDPELVKIVGVKEFDHFVNHRETLNEDIEPLFGKNLFSLTDKRWRDMRTTLSPAFTSSKMKAMYLLISECGKQLADNLERMINEKAATSKDMLSMDVKDFFTRFTNDVIASTAFGIKVDSLKEPDNDFYMMGKEVTNFGGIRMVIFFLYLLCPKLMAALNIKFLSPKCNTYFRSLVLDTIATREKEGIVRPDMIHLLMQAKKGELKADEGDDNNKNTAHKEIKTHLDEDDVVAQALIFFLAGFETSSNLLCFTTYLLAVHPAIRERLQEDIESTLKTHEDKLTYEAVQSMKYLDMVLNETLRLYPPVPAVDRVCVKSTTIPGTDKEAAIPVKEGQILWFPVYGFHKDPQFFPDPDKFDPERFSDENKHNIKPFTYMPFGVGPRICIAQRFALLEAKVALVHLLCRTNPCVVEKTPIPLVLSNKGFNLMAKGGFWTGFELRDTRTLIK